MKALVLAISLFSVPAFANPFNAFEAPYKIDGPVQITTLNVDTKKCMRFHLPKITALELVKDTAGYKQSHVISIRTAEGWSKVPIMQFEDQSEFDPTLKMFARISGGPNLASSHQGTTAKDHYEARLSFERTGGRVIFKYAEEYVESGTAVNGCYYQVNLK